MRTGITIGAALAFGWAYAQQSGQKPQAPVEGARELFYVAAKTKDTPPPRRPAVQRADVPPPPAPEAAAMHLGLRYNVVLVNPDTRATREADPDAVLPNGSCFAIDIVSNRSGYLYVLAKQSSGEWLPLLPSAEMPDENNLIEQGKKVRIPQSYCFEVHPPAGSETLFVVLSRDPRDVFDLYEGIKRQAAPAATRPPLLRADAGVPATVKKMTEMFGTRDIVIRKIDQPQAAAEPAHAVYVVNASDRPTASVATQIVVKHR